MDKRKTLLFVIFFSIVLLLSIKVYSILGTCYDEATGACDYIHDYRCYNTFYPNQQPVEITDCTLGCCCESKFSNNQVYPVTRGECEIVYEHLFLDISSTDCDLICDQVTFDTPLCSQSCQLNTQDCIGMKGRTIDVSVSGEFYCWENDQTYTSQASCNNGCPITPITSITPEGGCDGTNPPAVAVFNADHVKGKEQVTLTWENPCETPSKVVAYSIWRDPSHYLGTFFTGSTSFIDDDVTWGSTYTYYIKAHYISGMSSQQTPTSITLGSPYCDGLFGDEEFCLNNNGYSCNENNQIYTATYCDPSYTCVGPDEQGKTSCKLKTYCQEGGNPFGLFYTKDFCLTGNSYCYYDHSNTIIDECKDCSEIKDCYEYSSKYACLTDNCLISSAYSSESNSPCDWVDTFGEFGKGICYDEDYTGTDYCGLCSEDSNLFHNIDCNQNICTKLGSCFSDGSSCQPCSDNTKCEDFTNQESCVNAHLKGIQNREVTKTPAGCPLEITPSDDACSLGSCKWQNSLCFKDSNDDDIADCNTRAGFDPLCKQDFKPFNTIPQPDIPGINSRGYGITLYLTEASPGDSAYGSSFYFCIDKDNTCCPNTRKNIQPPTTGQDPFVVINPIDETGIITETRTYFLRYYTIDTHKNIEEVKSTEFFVDPVNPGMIINYSFYTEEEHHYLKIFVTTDEYANCNYALNNLPAEKIREDSFNSGFNTLFFIKFQDLEKGDYMFTATCYDTFGNYKSQSIRFDMADLTPPALTLIPDPPAVVYKQAYNITGLTEALVNIDVELYDEKGSLLETYSGYQGADISEPEPDFNQIPLGTNPDTLTFPRAGENEIFFEGDYRYNVGINDYLGFSYDPVTRYDITGVFDYMQGVKTRVIITPPIDRNIDGSKVTASSYLSPLATGFFEVPIEFGTGINNIKVIATRESGSSNYVTDRITYLDTYAPSIYLDYPPVWQGAVSTIKNPTFTGSITSTTTLPVQSSTLKINEVTYDLSLDQDSKFSQTVNLPVDGNYSFEIFASNSMDSKTKYGFIIIDSEGPGGCIRVGENIYCTIGGCRDSDKGKEYNKKGWTCAGNPVECLSDYCDNNRLKEYYCEGINKADEWYNCSGTCEDGACSIIKIAYSCQELASIMKASSASTCKDQKYDRRADINNDKDVDLSDQANLNLHINNATWCSEQLEDMTDPCEAICTDSDGGVDYYVKGNITGKDGEGYTYNEQEESCLNVPSPQGDEVYSSDYLGEFYCENDLVNADIYTCPNGCEDGSCINN